MKRIPLLLLCLGYGLLMAQTVDITDNSQNAALRDTAKVVLNASQLQTASYPSVSETYQIPAYDLYSACWDVENLKSCQLSIPFNNDRLMLILVQSANNPFELPCVFDNISLKYGLTKKGIFHPGVDLVVEPQTLVKSCFDGVVRMAKCYGDYGLLVAIRHYNGLETVYAHLDKLCVKPGQIVNAGDVIGQTGNSGNVKDYILHFETRFMNECFDPESIIDFDNETLVKNTLVLMPSDLNITKLDNFEKKPPVAPQQQAPQTQQQSLSTIANESVKEQATQPIEEKTAKETEEVTPTSLQKAFDGEEEYHVIQPGESLYRIALKYNTTTQELMRLNNIQNADKIAAGQKIRIR
ncbi:MAG: peptidoglycan DD-metalloendopeptidase family protein [Bacteroidales bacterium]|nr:peptidoglycan DD-metalloendopeptidase family protein [Bacteroidales bacterium]